MLFYEVLGNNDGCFAPRDTNKASHALAKFACSITEETVWLEGCPVFLEPIVLNDSLCSAVSKKKKKKRNNDNHLILQLTEMGLDFVFFPLLLPLGGV